MSDGGILIAQACGYDQNSLARKILVLPQAVAQICGNRDSIDRMTNEQVEAKLSEERSPQRDRLAFDAWTFNKWIDVAWHIWLGLGDDIPTKAADRRKAGYTKWLTPKEFDAIKCELKKIRIPQAAYTNDIWKEQTEALMEFLTGAKLPYGVSMDKNRPRLRPRVAENVVWFLQQVLGWGGEEIDVCSDCGRAIDTASETHDWCSKCGKMRCEGCTTEPSDCSCDYPCEKHCQCHRRGSHASKNRGRA